MWHYHLLPKRVKHTDRALRESRRRLAYQFGLAPVSFFFLETLICDHKNCCLIFHPSSSETPVLARLLTGLGTRGWIEVAARDWQASQCVHRGEPKFGEVDWAPSKMGTHPQKLRQLQIRPLVQFRVSFLLDLDRGCSVFAGAGRWPAKARRFEPHARRGRLHQAETNAMSAIVIDHICNSVFVVVAYATFPNLSRSGKQVVGIGSQSNDPVPTNFVHILSSVEDWLEQPLTGTKTKVKSVQTKLPKVQQEFDVKWDGVMGDILLPEGQQSTRLALRSPALDKEKRRPFWHARRGRSRRLIIEGRPSPWLKLTRFTGKLSSNSTVAHNIGKEQRSEDFHGKRTKDRAIQNMTAHTPERLLPTSDYFAGK